MSRFVHNILAGWLLLACDAFASQEPSIPEVQTNSVMKIEGESDKALSIVTIGLAARPSWNIPDVQDHGTFIQIILPTTIVPEPGTFIEANSPFFTKIAAFQVNNQVSGEPTDAAVRVFVNREAAAIKDAVVAEILADRIVITLDHRKLEASLARAGSTAVATSGAAPQQEATTGNATPDSNDSLAPITEPRDPTPAEIVRSDSTAENGDPSWPKPGIRVPDLSGKLSIVAGFSIFMLMLMGGVYWFKRANPLQHVRASFQSPFQNMKGIIKHRVPGSEDGDDFARDIAMKTVSSMTIGPRQKLTLVQVGTESVLLAVTPTGIQFLTTVGSSSRGLMLPQSTAFHAASQPRLPLNAVENSNFEDRLTSETVDEAPQSAKPVKVPGKPAVKITNRQGASATKKVRVAVGDTGITNLDDKKESHNTGTGRDDVKPTDDITRLIREKLRNLPAI